MALTIRNEKIESDLEIIKKEYQIKTASKAIEKAVQIATTDYMNTLVELERTKAEKEKYKELYEELKSLVEQRNEIDIKLNKVLTR